MAMSISESFMNELNESQNVSDKIDNICEELSGITKKPIIYDLYLKTVGKITGLLRHILQNPKHRKDLCMLIDIPTSLIDLFDKYGGSLPYIKKDTNEIINGKEMNADKLKDIVIYTANRLNIELKDDDLETLDNEKWRKLINDRYNSLIKALEVKKETKINPDEFD